MRTETDLEAERNRLHVMAKTAVGERFMELLGAILALDWALGRTQQGLSGRLTLPLTRPEPLANRD